jgi:hypothetical protein
MKSEREVDDIKLKLKRYEYYNPKYLDFNHKSLNELKFFLELFTD